jgi:hypothetical protein
VAAAATPPKTISSSAIGSGSAQGFPDITVPSAPAAQWDG